MERDQHEGSDPAAQEAAEEWRRRFGREGHEGSYSPQLTEESDADDAAAEPSRTSPSD